MNAFSRRNTLTIGFLGSALFLVFSIPGLNDLVIVDEAIFASTIRSVSQTGVAKYYAGESVGSKGGLWHPPTYIYYVAAWFSSFGASSVVARIATLMFSLLTVPVVGLLGAKIAIETGDTDPKISATAAVLLYVTAPLVIQNGTLVDIDGSMLALGVSLFLYWALDNFEPTVDNWPRTFLGIVGWFACLTWIKFGMLPVLLLCFFIYTTYKEGLKRGVKAASGALAGIVIFILTWGVVSMIFDLSFVEPFIHNFGSILEGSRNISTQKRLLMSAWGLYIELLWLSPFLLIIGVMALFREVPSGVAELRRQTIQSGSALLLSVSILTILQYAILAKVPYGFPKYLGIVTPLMSALGGVVAARTMLLRRSRKMWALSGGLVVVVALGIFLIRDPFLVSFNRGYGTVVRQSLGTLLSVAGLGTIVYLILSNSGQAIGKQQLVTTVLIILLLGMNGGLLAQQATADYSTQYFYGIEETEGAISETTSAYENLSTAEQKETVLPVDFGFYVDGRFHASKRYTVSDFRSNSPPLIVLRIRKYYAVDSPLLNAVRSSDRYTSERRGSYIIFRRNNS